MLLGRPGAAVRGMAGMLIYRHKGNLEDRETQVRRRARRAIHHRLHQTLLSIWELAG